ncbi:hypothetical protein DYB32_008471 [Aphanomyces invadans]|uniref:Uncharacterized protein n=1 Tax=Aphanomyces invadans TaxID=157072 RepID=A0A418ALI5_9STRA|nr:hypothetical protein DYB32_008471 [Aphanomyces invadans]
MRTPTSPQTDLLPTKRHSCKMTTAPKYKIAPVGGSSRNRPSQSVFDIPYALDGIKCREPSLEPSPFVFHPSNEYQLHGVAVKPQSSDIGASSSTFPTTASHPTTTLSSISRFQMYYHLHKQHTTEAPATTSHRRRNASSIAFLLS